LFVNTFFHFFWDFLKKGSFAHFPFLFLFGL